MSGFMAGFGSAFAKSFGDAEAERAKKEDDQFQLMYSEAIKRRDKIEEINRTNAKNIKAAKAIAEMEGAPPEAWPKAYEMLSADMPQDVVRKFFHENKAVVTPTSNVGNDNSAPADPRDGLTQGAQTSVDAQMQTSGMTPPANGGIFGDVKSGIQDATNSVFGTPEERAKRKSDKMNSRVAETMGSTPEDLQKIMAPGSIQGDPVPGLDNVQVQWESRGNSAEDIAREQLLYNRAREAKADSRAERSLTLQESRDEFDRNQVALENRRWDTQHANDSEMQHLDLWAKKIQIEGQMLDNKYKTDMSPKEKMEFDRKVQDHQDEMNQWNAEFGQKVRMNDETIKQNDISNTQDAEKIAIDKQKASNANVMQMKDVNSPADAATYLEQQKQIGTPESIKQAENLLAQQMHVQASTAHRTAVMNGTAPETSAYRAAILDDRRQDTGKIALPEIDGQGNEVWKDEFGNPVDETHLKKYDANMEKDVDEITKTLGPEIQKYNSDVENFKSLVRTSDDLSNLAKQYPEAMGASGDLAGMADYLRRAGINIAKIVVGPKTDADGNVIPDDGAIGQAEQAEAYLQKQLQGPIDRTARIALVQSLMDIKATKLAYMWAADMNQKGNGVSNKDFQNFRDAAKGNENPEALALSAADFIEEKYQNLKDQEANLNANSGPVIGFESKYHIKSPFSVQSVDKTISNDPTTKSALERFNETKKNNTLTQSKQPNKSTDKVPEGIGVTQEEWDVMPAEDKKLWQ